MKFTAGNCGPKVRSDCYVEIIPQEVGGINLTLESKVLPHYGDSIKEKIDQVLKFYEVENVKIDVKDYGAFDWILLARLESAIRLMTGSTSEYLPEILSENTLSTKKDRNRFSRLYLPGNSPKMMINAGLHKPKGIILDLEDAVAFPKKSEARFIVRNALRACKFYGAERMVRINQGKMGLEDLDYIVPHGVNLILIPKCESDDQIHLVNSRIEAIKSHLAISHSIWLMPIVESALGVANAFSIAKAASNVAALAIGLEDYTADLGTRRTNDATESYYARCQLVNAAKAAGIQAIDSVFSDVGDQEALKQNVLKSKSLGFDGMGCIHPRQIHVIHENYAPDDTDIEKSKKIYLAFKDAQKRGLGVVSLGTKMIDPPVVKRAETTINMAIETGKLDKNWEACYE
ncbi:MAG: aldolase/citrate lyase family protein [Bacteroidales bacterium]